MNFIFLGGKAIGNYILSGLIENGYKPKGIILYQNILEPEILKKSKVLGINILEISSFKKQQDDIEIFIKTLDVNVLISVAFPFVLPKIILDLIKYPINVHTGAIPKYRGHHPISAALLNDEPYQATTIHIMAEEVDAGEILLQDFVEIRNEDTILSIRNKLSELSLKLLFVVINQLKANSIYPKKQIGNVIWAPKRTPEDSKIDFNKSSRYLHNFIRALVDPYPNAYAFNSNGEMVKFKKSFSNNSPGIVLAKLESKQYIISTFDGIIWIESDVDLVVGERLK